MSKCKSCNNKVLSNISNTELWPDICTDVCVNPKCGNPSVLSVMAPVIYDEIGINVCRTIDLGDLLTTYPTTTYINADIVDISYATAGPTPVTITPIATRPNCYTVTLESITVTFLLKLYDCCKNLLTTSVQTGLYLPPATDASSDDDTNPPQATLEIFAPYGVSYADATAVLPNLNVIASTAANSSISQGLNLWGLPKVLAFDTIASTATIGVTFVVSSIYVIPYDFSHRGKSSISKGDLANEEESVCMDFVNGGLLDRNIKPLELSDPFESKEPCNDDVDIDPCNSN